MSDSLPAAEYQKVCRYFEKIGKLLAIHWDLLVDPDYDPDPTVNARVVPTTNRHMATVHIGQGWLDLSPRDKTEVVVHELIHVMNAKVNQFVMDVVCEAMPNTAKRIAADTYDNLDEQFVDRVSFALASLVPEWK